MQHRVWKNVLTFVLVLVLTVGAVTTLSMATAAKTETAPARYSQQVRESQAPVAAELSADVKEEGSPVVSLAAFAMVLSIPVSGVFFYLRSRKKGRDPVEKRGRRYSPRADMSFRNVPSVKRV